MAKTLYAIGYIKYATMLFDFGLPVGLPNIYFTVIGNISAAAYGSLRPFLIDADHKQPCSGNQKCE